MGEVINLFVYGTLLSWREWAEPVDTFNFPKVAPFVLKTHPATLDGAVLYDFGSFPGAYPGLGTIVGEIQVVDSDAFEVLDILEGHPEIFYRERVTAKIGGDNEIPAWIYWAPEELRHMGKIIPSGDWLRRQRG